MSTPIPGYDVPAVEAWISTHVRGLTPPLRWTRLEGGHSNLTYRLDDAQGRSAVIRRPPMGELLPKAHDMEREWQLISALGSTACRSASTSMKEWANTMRRSAGTQRRVSAAL